MFTVTVYHKGRRIVKNCEHKTAVKEVLESCGISQDRPCGGKGLCGKCKVEINGVEVLACMAYVEENCIIKTESDAENTRILLSGSEMDFEKNPLVKSGIGMAVDIGTTTVAGYVYKFPECECIKIAGFKNAQTKFGADVISRIEYSANGGLAGLKEVILAQIEEIASGYDVEKTVITGNAAMLHFYAGLDASGMAVAPFTAKSMFGCMEGDVYIPGCISAYVGADITTAVLASRMNENKISFLVDIGTNGEMVLYKDSKYTCCSTAAGPAFEGAGISRGMLAADGAINRVWTEEGEVCYSVIGETVAKGICGSGLIDAVAVMLELGILDETGFLEEPFRIGDSDVYVTCEDIRRFQLAKSAIRSGIDTLFHECGVTCEDIEEFYIAGGFGSYINKESAVRTGLIPAGVAENVSVIGNAAGKGAVMILMSEEKLHEAEEIVKNAVSAELASSSFFAEKYIENMMF